jgi:hypothetical protein
MSSPCQVSQSHVPLYFLFLLLTFLYLPVTYKDLHIGIWLASAVGDSLIHKNSNNGWASLIPIHVVCDTETMSSLKK